MPETEYSLYPIGFIRSPLKHPEEAPKQGSEGAPDAWLEVGQITILSVAILFCILCCILAI